MSTTQLCCLAKCQQYNPILWPGYNSCISSQVALGRFLENVKMLAGDCDILRICKFLHLFVLSNISFIWSFVFGLNNKIWIIGVDISKKTGQNCLATQLSFFSETSRSLEDSRNGFWLLFVCSTSIYFLNEICLSELFRVPGRQQKYVHTATI